MVYSFHTTQPTFYLRNANAMVSSRLSKPRRYHCIDASEIKSRLWNGMHPTVHIPSKCFVDICCRIDRWGLVPSLQNSFVICEVIGET